MNLDDFITVCCLVGFVISYGVYRYFRQNVYLTYKVHKFPNKTKEQRDER